MPRLSRPRSGRPPSSLPSAPLGAHSRPPSDRSGRRRACHRGVVSLPPPTVTRSRGRAGRFLSACLGRAAAALLPGCATIRAAAPARARAHPATGGRGQARRTRPGLRRRTVAGVLASALLGFAALLAAPQTAHAVDKEIFSRTLTTAPESATSTTVFGFGFFSGNQFGSFGTNAQRTIAEISDPGADARYLSRLLHRNPTNELLLSFSGAASEDRDLLDIEDFRARLTLEVGTTSYAGSSGSYSSTNREFVWGSTGLTWADMETYSVRLTLDVPGIDSIAVQQRRPRQHLLPRRGRDGDGDLRRGGDRQRDAAAHDQGGQCGQGAGPTARGPARRRSCSRDTRWPPGIRTPTASPSRPTSSTSTAARSRPLPAAIRTPSSPTTRWPPPRATRCPAWRRRWCRATSRVLRCRPTRRPPPAVSSGPTMMVGPGPPVSSSGPAPTAGRRGVTR